MALSDVRTVGYGMPDLHTYIEKGAKWLRCPQCHYDLRGLVDFTCPECGNVFDPAELQRQYVDSAREHELRDEIYGKETRISLRFLGWFAITLVGLGFVSCSIREIYLSLPGVDRGSCTNGGNNTYLLIVQDIPALLAVIAIPYFAWKYAVRLRRNGITKTFWSSVQFGMGLLLLVFFCLRGCTRSIAYFD